MSPGGRPDAAISRTGIQAEVQVEGQAYARAARRRFEATLRHVKVVREPVLDLGPPNALAREVERRHGVHLEHTGAHDLDRERLATFCAGPYATITAFEILEHLLNPLFVLDGCLEVIQPDGVLYVSVPRRNGCEWVFGKSPEHFHEFAPDELRWVLEKAGFAVVREAQVNSSVLAPGIRPLLRRLLCNLLVLECRPRGASGG